MNFANLMIFRRQHPLFLRAKKVGCAPFVRRGCENNSKGTRSQVASFLFEVVLMCTITFTIMKEFTKWEPTCMDQLE